MTDQHVHRIAEQLADRRDWEGLWRLAQDVPLAAGVGIVGLLDDWVPHADGDRALLRAMREADPASIEAASARLRAEAPVAASPATFLPFFPVNTMSFAPDGPFLAAADIDNVVNVFDLRTAGAVEKYEFPARVMNVLHTANGRVLATELPGHDESACLLMQNGRDGYRPPPFRAVAFITALVRTDHDGGFVASTRSDQLVLGTRDAVWVAPITAPGFQPRRPVAIAHPDSGGFVIVDHALPGTLQLYAPQTGDTGHVRTGGVVVQAEFLDAESIVCLERTRLTRLSLRDGRYRPWSRPPLTGDAKIAVLPGSGHVVVADASGDVQFLNSAGTTIGSRAAIRSGRPTGLTVSPGGDFIAVTHDSLGISLFDLRAAKAPLLLGRPIADLAPPDLAVVTAFLTHATPLQPGDRSALELLRAALQHRFRSDTEAGTALQLLADDQDQDAR